MRKRWPVRLFLYFFINTFYAHLLHVNHLIHSRAFFGHDRITRFNYVTYCDFSGRNVRDVLRYFVVYAIAHGIRNLIVFVEFNDQTVIQELRIIFLRLKQNGTKLI